MVALDNYPSGLIEALDRKGVAADKLMLIAKCDMNKEGAHCDCFLAATAEELLVISGITTLREKKGLTKNAKLLSGAAASRLEAAFEELSYECFMLADTTDFRVEELLSSARLVAKDKKSDRDVLIAVFTNTS